MKSYLPQKGILFLNTKTMLTKRVHVPYNCWVTKSYFFNIKGKLKQEQGTLSH